MRRSILAAFAVVTACQSSVEREEPAAVAQAVVQPELQLSVPPTGPGSFSQGNAVIAQGPDRWLVVWADDRANGLRGSDIYGARVLFDGGVLDPTGFPICTAPEDQGWPAVAYSNGAFTVAWSDARHVGTDRNALFSATVTLDGGVSPPNGRDLQVGYGFQNVPFVAAGPGAEMVGVTTTNAGVWASFNGKPSRQVHVGGRTPPRVVWDGRRFLMVQEDVAGTWFTVGRYFDADGGAVPLADGGYLFKIIDLQGYGGADFATAGTRPDGGVLVTMVAGENFRLHIAGALVTDFETVSTPVTDGGLWWQHFSSGVGPDLYNFDVSILGTDDGWWTAWRMEPYTRTPPTMQLQQLTPDLQQSLIYELSDAGAPPVRQYEGNFQPDSNAPVLAASPGQLAAVVSELAQVGGAGHVAFSIFTRDGVRRRHVRLTTLQSSDETPAVACGVQYCLVAWMQAGPEATQRDLYFRRFDLGSGFAEASATVLSSSPDDEVYPRVTYRGGTFWVGYSTSNNGHGFVRAVDELTGAVRAPDQIPQNFYGIAPLDVAMMGDDVIAVSGHNHAVRMFVLTDGGLTLTTVANTSSGGAYRNVGIASRGSDALVAWREQFIGRVEAIAFKSDGGFDPVRRLTAAAQRMPANDPVVATDGTNYLVVFDDFVGSDRRVLGVFVRPDGGLSPDDGGFTISPAAGHHAHPAVTYANGQYVVAWERAAAEHLPTDLAYTTVSKDGVVGNDSTGDVLTASSDNELAVRLAPQGTTGVVAVYNRLDGPGGGVTAHLRKLSVKAAVGSPCVGNAQCTTGACVDGVCCATSCGNSNPADCQACSADAGSQGPPGQCTPIRPGVVCLAAAADCDQDDVCNGTSTACPARYFTSGETCGGGNGMCDFNACCISNLTGDPLSCARPDGGADAGIDGGVDAGVDGGSGGGAGGGAGGGGGSAGGGAAGGGSAGGGAAGGGAAGGGAAGGGAAGGGAAGGGAADAGVPDAGVPEGSVSHYGWDQGGGCGCSSGSAPGFLVLPLLMLVGGRLRRKLPWAAAMLVVLAGSIATAEPRTERLKLAYPGLSESSGIDPAVARSISEYLQTRLSTFNYYQLISSADVSSIIGMERQRTLLGCSDAASSCMAELAGALDVDRLLNASISKVGESLLLNVALVDARSGTALKRAGARLKGGTLDDALDAVDVVLRELISADAPAQTAATAWSERTGGAVVPLSGPAPPPPSAAASADAPKDHGGWHAVVGVRGEADLAGLAAGNAAIVPSLSFAVFTGWVGAAAMVVVAPTPGVRLEGRLIPLPDTLVRPYVGLGGTLFGAAFGARGAIGAGLTYEHIHFSADIAAEYFVSGQDKYRRLAALLSLGAGWEF